MSGQKTTIAFFGATGGCANWALVLALQGGHTCRALARTPSKLTDMLTANGVSQEAITKQLHIVQGDARDSSAVKATLQQTATSAPVDVIVSGIGMDAMGANPDATICQDTTTTILAALREIRGAAGAGTKKPHFGIISTTGISENRDVPIAFLPMYHWLLKVPHADKKVMEGIVSKEVESEDSVVGAYTFLRPAFLTDRDEAKGPERWEIGSEEKPAVGYTCPRKDVGLWLYSQLIEGDKAAQWRNTKPSLVAH